MVVVVVVELSVLVRPYVDRPFELSVEEVTLDPGGRIELNCP